MKPQPKVAAKTGKAAAKAKPAATLAKSAKTAKPAAKSPAKKAAAKPAAKVPAKKAPAKVAAKSPAKTAPVRKTPAKTTPPAAKKAAPAPKAKPVAKQPAAKGEATKTKAGPAKAPATAVQAPARAMPPRHEAATLAAEPTRSTKPSARLAQITVPSMAQSVASTAAKASYTQTMSPSVLTPPPLVAIKKDPKLANNWKSKPAEELSDAEVLAMPDSEYMNEKQMAFFRLKLMRLKQDILDNAGETTEHLREETVIVPDPADRATIEEEHALELRTRDRERKLLKKIEQSIGRIDAGDYGYCDETGEPIGVGRLLARPTATLSLEAQQRRELKQKMFGD
ncbi:RNA polymerase-binding protein DksA [Ramlibacter sp.]|uniref:RNA polymerase-binding protein DksA n=1 Tax=Ramlibacter sp. TaxID=1917967 RepID=UPI002C8D6A0A|nr:RNA polymerase-binding protein DksA [Ramlibacter sp.]HWI84268.1 RNA polymerase-binding protein DksA [Ramlibacter sp.]